MKFHIPTKPYSITDHINRIGAATGSMRNAKLTEDANYNGHSLSVWWNDYNGYYIAEYPWGGRNVIARGSAENVIKFALSWFKSQGRGASISVSLKEEHAPVADLFPELVKGEEDWKSLPWRNWKWEEACPAFRWEQTFGCPALAFLIKSETKEEFETMKSDWHNRAKKNPTPQILAVIGQ